MTKNSKTVARSTNRTTETNAQSHGRPANAEVGGYPPRLGEGQFPTVRMRRLRYHPLVRNLVRETRLSVDDLILPLFVRPGRGVKKEIPSMPGNYQLSVDG
jgi:hypothetical protein